MARAMAALVWIAAASSLPNITTPGSDAGPPSDRVIPVRVEDGQARIHLPAGSAESGYLAVVSLAARQTRTGRVRLEVRAAADTQTPPEPLASEPLTVTLHGAEAEPVRLPEPAVSRPPNHRVFYLLARPGDPASPANYESRSAQLRALGQRVQVYVDQDDLDAVASPTLQDVVRTFDSVIWPALASRFGSAADVDHDERLTVLFSRAVGCVASATDPVDGYTRPADFDRRIAPPLGNQADMVCLHPRLTAGPHLRTVLAHEYAHAILVTRRVILGAGVEEEGWIDEALAHLVEDELGLSRSNVLHRVQAYLADPSAFSLVVDDYYGRGLFRSHGHRGAAYLFLRWCVAQGGPDALDALVMAPRSGVANLEATFGVSFDELFRGWATSQALAAECPRFERLDPGQHLSWSAVPTSCRYVWIPVDSTDGGVELIFDADPALKPQLTLIRRATAPSAPSLSP
ncbi:MAG: hypothetical protein KatS3mg108_3384 [Isosphaeraceae bacterium]|jgi:hypothetical protein|nr:MAG: hypothetical protein KatS3mg108_3384 [Isosphaeraceae bacterium]